MLIGAHSIIYSTAPEADREFLADVLRLPNVDVGEGWLIFGLPPAEVAVILERQRCARVLSDVRRHRRVPRGDDTHNIASTPVQDQGWGRLSQITLPGGGRLGIYQPQHARPEPISMGKDGEAAARRRVGFGPSREVTMADALVVRSNCSGSTSRSWSRGGDYWAPDGHDREKRGSKSPPLAMLYPGFVARECTE